MRNFHIYITINNHKSKRYKSKPNKKQQQKKSKQLNKQSLLNKSRIYHQIMNLQQFLSQQSIDTLLHQFFSIQGESQKSRQQQSTLINSIVLAMASSHKTTFAQLYQECQYQLEVNNLEREAVKKMCRLMVGVLGKASYLLRNVQIAFFVDEVLGFFLGKVFVTVCSADCIRCIWALINAYTLSNRTQQDTTKSAKTQGGCGSSSNTKGCCSTTNNTSQMKEQSQQQSGCCKGNNSNTSSCCKSSTSTSIIPSFIANHQRICKSLVSKLLSDFKLHVKTYPFKVRKDIYRLINYVLKLVQLSQEQLLSTIAGKEVNKLSQQINSSSTKPLLVEIGITKHEIIQLVIKSLCDQKDPRNMTLIFQSYLLLINQFAQQIGTFNYTTQIFQNIEGYYPLSMQGDQNEFKVDSQDMFNENQLKQLLDECLLNELFRNDVRQMLVEKMLAPPIHQYASLYVKFITKFNPSTYHFINKSINLQEQTQKYSILTMNLLNRLCEEEYLDQNYQSSSCNDGGCGDGGCGSGKSKGACSETFSIAELISTIIKNVFIFTSTHKNSSLAYQNIYQTYSRSCEQKYVQFLNNLIVHKLFNHEENNKHAGTIIEIVKTILNPHSRTVVQSKNIAVTEKTQEHAHTTEESSCCGGGGQEPKNDGGCCGGGGCGSTSGGCGPSSSNTKNSHSSLTPTPVSPTKLPYGQKISYQQMLITFITHKFMHYWSAKGDVAFKFGLLIITLNKKLQNISVNHFLYPSANNESTQNTLQHLLITLGNVYETYKATDQIKIMVLKTLMIMTSMVGKLYVSQEMQEKNINKIRKINNSIVHKDCIKFSFLLKESSQTLQENDFSRSQNHILKSYVDYLMEVYVNFGAGSQNIAKETEEMLQNVFGSFDEDKVFGDMRETDNKVKYLDVKLYAAVRYLSIHASKQGATISKQIMQQPIKLVLSMLLSPHQQSTNKLLSLLKYYTYPVLVSVMGMLYRHISLFSDSFPLTNSSSLESLFINISLAGKIIAQKFEDYYTVELELGSNYGRLIIGDIQKCFESHLINSESKSINRLVKILLWYMFRKLWRRESPESLEVSFADSEVSSELSRQEQFCELIYTSAKERISIWIKLYSNRDNLKELTFTTNSHQKVSDLQCSLLYVKYLQAHKSQQNLRFNKRLAQLYDSGMIEYFWNRLLNCMTYSEKSIISPQAKQELIQLIEHLPQKILILHAEQIAPVVIYDTVVEEGRMVQENKEKLTTRDQFDYCKTELIGKLSQNLPENSLILYVLPYCLNFLKTAAISSQKNISIPQEIIPLSQSVQALLNINKIVFILLEKSQQKASEKSFKYEKLKKSLTQTHKKEFNIYFSRLIYHKKRNIRQSSRTLLMSFQ